MAIENLVLGRAEDLASTRRMISLFRLTHWVCFMIAVVAAVKGAGTYLGVGEGWQATPGSPEERMLMQTLAITGLWLLITGIALLSGFITWANTDVLMNRAIILEQGAGQGQAVVQTPAESPSPTSA